MLGSACRCVALDVCRLVKVDAVMLSTFRLCYEQMDCDNVKSMLEINKEAAMLLLE